MNVVHIALGLIPVPSLDRAGGVEHDIYCLTNHLVQQGCRASIIDIKTAPEERSGALARFIEVWNVPLPGRRGLAVLPKSIAVSLLAARVLNTLLKREDFDIVHMHSPYNVLAVRFLTPLKGKVPLILTIHSPILPGPESLRRKVGAAVENLAFRSADFLITRTRESRAHIISRIAIAPEKIACIPVAIDTEKIEAVLADGHGTSHHPATVLCAGRIEPRKNQMTLVRAVPQVVAECPDVRFVFTGPIDDPGYFRSIQAFVRQESLSRWIQFVGTVPQRELYELYRDAAVFVFPSLGEMFPQALIEALGFGLPVIGADIPSVAEIVGPDKGAAILVRPSDPGAYSTTIVSLLRDVDRRRELSARAREVAQHYGCRRTAQDMLRLYERWLRSFANSNGSTPDMTGSALQKRGHTSLLREPGDE